MRSGPWGVRSRFHEDEIVRTLVEDDVHFALSDLQAAGGIENLPPQQNSWGVSARVSPQVRDRSPFPPLRGSCSRTLF